MNPGCYKARASAAGDGGRWRTASAECHSEFNRRRDCGRERGTGRGSESQARSKL